MKLNSPVVIICGPYRKLLLALAALFSITSVHSQDLQLLNYKQRLDYARANRFPVLKTVFKDTLGTVIKLINPSYPVFGGELYSGSDYYVNSEGQIVEVVLRKGNSFDKVLNEKLFDIEEENTRGSMEIPKIICAGRKDALIEILNTELSNYKNEKIIDAELNNINEARLVGILEQCPAPTLATVGTEGMRATFLVLVHARRKYQEKYFSLLQEFVKSGALQKQALCAIEDRLLRASGLKQKYGTQIVFFPRTGYELYPIENPGRVDEIRGAAGLPTLDEYLLNREEFYDAEIRK